MKSKFCSAVIVCIIAIFLPASQLQAVVSCDNEIIATSTAEYTPAGAFPGWYLYTIEVEWDFGQDLSHWDLILKLGCRDEDHFIEGATGSTGEGEAIIAWVGSLERNGDPSLDPQVTDPVLKYEPASAPGQSGSGIFIFYSNIIPEDNGPYPDLIVGKSGICPDTYGPLYGDYPSCNTVPEPATVLMLGLGATFLVGKKTLRL